MRGTEQTSTMISTLIDNTQQRLWDSRNGGRPENSENNVRRVVLQNRSNDSLEGAGYDYE